MDGDKQKTDSITPPQRTEMNTVYGHMVHPNPTVGRLHLDEADTVDAVLLASGLSTRFEGANKLLAHFCGKPVAQYALELFCRLPYINRVFFATAHDELAALCAHFPATLLKNSAPEKGRCESVRLGARASAAKHMLFVPCDQPMLDEATVKAVLAKRGLGKIVVPTHSGAHKSPVLFSEMFREELIALKDGEAPRTVKQRHPEAVVAVDAPNPLALEDIDTVDDLKKLEAVARAMGMGFGGRRV